MNCGVLDRIFKDRYRRVIIKSMPEVFRVRWLGHACFYLKSPGGVSIVTDPFGSEVPYPDISLEAAVVTVSHEHYDHNKVEVVKGDPRVLRGLDPSTKKFRKVKETIGDVEFETFPSFHDDVKGQKRGENAIFAMDFQGMRVVHLGDLGHPLGSDVISQLGKVDVLLIPVGGYYTIDGDTAREVVKALSPKVAVPMHYKTKYTSGWPISDASAFLEGLKRVVKRCGSQVDITPERLPKDGEVWVLEV